MEKDPVADSRCIGTWRRGICGRGSPSDYGGGLTYIVQLDDAVLTDSEYDVGLVASVGLSCSF